VNLQAFDFENNHWVPFSTFVSQTEPHRDAKGTEAYGWEGAALLPSHGRYWRQDPNAHNLYANIRLISGEFPLHTFDKEADACIQRESKNGGLAVLNQCKSSSSPVITIKRPCGYQASACCKGNALPCRGELACDSEGICTRAQWEVQGGNTAGSGVGNLSPQFIGPEDLRGDPNPVQYPGLGGPSGIGPPDDGGAVDHSICQRAGEKSCCAGPPPFGGPMWCQHRYICQSNDHPVTGVYRYGGGYVCGWCVGWNC
jgi:hypothetical protein